MQILRKLLIVDKSGRAGRKFYPPWIRAAKLPNRIFAANGLEITGTEARISHPQRGVNNRLSRLSSSEAIFNAAAPPYQDALRKADYLQKLLYDPSDKGVRN